MMKHTLPLAAALLLTCGTVTATAQTTSDSRENIVYYTPKQKPQTFSVWVDDIQFGPKRTIVTLHYLQSSGGANLIPSTKLICHLRGGKTKVLDLQDTRGISMRKDTYTQLGRGEVFRAYFPALEAEDIAKIKSIDFMEDPSRKFGGNVFNITDIKISKKQQVVR